MLWILQLFEASGAVLSTNIPIRHILFMNCCKMQIRSEENAVDIQIHKEYAGAMTSSARHVTKDIPRIPQMQIAEDGWDSLEITQLVRFFRNLAKVDANEMDAMTRNFSMRLQDDYVKRHPEDQQGQGLRSYEAIASRIAGLNFLRMGASAEEAGIPSLYEQIYRREQEPS